MRLLTCWALSISPQRTGISIYIGAADISVIAFSKSCVVAIIYESDKILLIIRVMGICDDTLILARDKKTYERKKAFPTGWSIVKGSIPRRSRAL